jgi:L-ribulose-5-phosphate 3-epimerase
VTDQPATSTPTRPMARLSLKYNMVEEDKLSILEKFQLIKDLGFDGVEIDAPGALPLDEVLAARDSTGLLIPGVINAMHWKTPLTDPDPAVRGACVTATKQALDAARACGATTVLLVPGTVTATTSYKTAYQRAVDGIGEILPYAEALGVSLALENVWNDFLLSPLEAAALVDYFDSPQLGWYLDIGNLLRYARPAHWIEALGPRILKLDIKEFSLAKMNTQGPWKGFEVELGDGDCDWPSVNQVLANVGYSGWASVEVPGGNRQRLAEIKRRADAIMAA